MALRIAAGALLALAATAAQAGDAARGRALVLDRQKSLCLLCHSGPFPEAPFQGDLAPDLAGVGARLGAEEMRERLLEPARSNPATIMPAYGRSSGFFRVAGRFAGQPLLQPEQIEDIVAFLSALRE